jgi:hypothetical protein
MARTPGALAIHLRWRHSDRRRAQRSRLPRPLKQLGARGAVAKPLAAESQPVVVKVDTPGAHARGIQPGYLQHGKGLEQTDALLYGPGAGDPHRFTQQMREDHHRFTLAVSFPDFPQHPQFDRTRFIEQFMRQMERDIGLPLQWMAANHYDTAHPHTHILMRGVSHGEAIYMKPGYFQHGLRAQASRLLTAFVGPMRARDQTIEQAQCRANQESIGHGPRRLNGIMLGADAPDLGPLTRQQILQRAQPTQRGGIPLARPPVQPTDGHEGLAAHVTQLWERMQAQALARQPSRQRGWGR